MFGCDAFLNIAHDANWRYIKERIPYKYNKGDQLIIKGDYSAKYANIAYKGPYTVTTVNNNGNVCVDIGVITDVINTCNAHPYPSK